MLFTYLATAMFIYSPPKLKLTVVSNPHLSKPGLEENNLNLLPGQMQLSPSDKTTPEDHRWSVTFPKDMLSLRCINPAIVLILIIRCLPQRRILLAC